MQNTEGNRGTEEQTSRSIEAGTLVEGGVLFVED